MTIATDLQSIINQKEVIRQAIIAKGVEVPEDAKIDAYYEYISQISGSSSYDPANPTLEGLKAALDAEDYAAFPPGTEIPDTYAGQDNPLIVAQYLDNTNNSDYNGAEGAILVRKYAEPSQAFGTTGSYPSSTILSFLRTGYYDNCSDALKSLLSDITRFWNNGSSQISISGKWHLMSKNEIGGTPVEGEGFFWDYWKQKTGLSSPSDTNNANRIVRDRNGSAKVVWLQTRQSATNIYCINLAGGVSYYPYSNGPYGVLPACFIAKSSSPAPDAPDLSKVLTKQDLDDIQAIVTAGKASEKFELGQELLISYGNYTMPFQIVGFDDVEIESGDTVPAINLLAKYTSEDSVHTQWASNADEPYSASMLRSSIITTYQGKLDSNFVNSLANTKIRTFCRDRDVDTVYDKLYAPSMQQLGITDSAFNNVSQAAVEGSTFPAFKDSTAADRVKYSVNTKNAPQWYWTRDVYLAFANAFGSITPDGEPEPVSYDSDQWVVVGCNLIGKL